MKKQIIFELNKTERLGTRKLIDWMISNGFFTQSCSKNHHLNIKGGLAKHSWNVYQLFKEKNKRYNLGLLDSSVIICGLLHDICKTDLYKKTEKGYDYNDKFPIGHGEKSVIIIQKFIELTEEECCIIRWHMAGFDLSQYGKSAYYKAIEMYPSCLALHTADYEATTFLEN